MLTQAYDGEFKPFGEARHRIKGKKETAFDIYFTLYQALDVEKDVGEEKETELYKLYPPDYFQYIIIDECHRGASTQGGSWRKILDYFKPKFILGLILSVAGIWWAFYDFEYHSFIKALSDSKLFLGQTHFLSTQ